MFCSIFQKWILFLLFIITFGSAIEQKLWPANVNDLTVYQNESELRFAEVDVRYLSSEMVNSLHAIKDLEFRYGQIDKAYVKPELQKFNMYHTRTTEIEIDPSKSYQTIYLEVTLCLLTSLPQHMQRLNNVRKLNFYSNEIQFINMDELNQLQNLEYINLSQNRIIAVRASAEISLPKLMHLYLSRNQLSSFEVCNWHLPNLQEIGLSSNQLSHIVLNTAEFPKMNTIKLHFNPLDCNWLREIEGKIKNSSLLKTGRCLNNYTNSSFPVGCIEADLSKCGEQQKINTELIVNALDAERGSYPWHAAIYVEKSNIEYICGGSLISRTFVLTAAHCVLNPQTRKTISSRFLLVQLGMHVLNEVDQRIQEFKVKNIYKYDNFTKNVNDIALLELAGRAVYTAFVQPICINDSGDLTGQYGTVVGWGLKSDNQLATVLQAIQMPVYDTLECLLSSPTFFGSTLNRGVMCAGYSNGTTICNGDSGGGLHFQGKHKWFIGGVVAFSEIRPGKTNVCRTDGFGGFTNVSYHSTWIKSIVKF